MSRLRTLPLIAAAVLGSMLLGSSSALAKLPVRPLRCDAGLKAAFKSDRLTTVVLVKAFKKGDPLTLSPGAAAPMPAGLPMMQTPNATNDLCLVKLVVGPGNPGPVGAPSTSKGIGIEVWLPAPAHWNRRVHAIGGGGWVGGPAGSAAAIADPRPPMIAASEGAVTSITDGGHSGFAPGSPSSGGDFAMLPDGTVNRVLWKDLMLRSVHEQAVKTKKLAKAFYGSAPKYSYWDGASMGGREAYALAQNYPGDFDGIIGNMPAINFGRFAAAGLYAQVLFQRELGGAPLSEAQEDLVSNAAIKACDLVDGQHLGYILDNAACRYDPTTDPDVLCAADGGKNSTPACVNKVQAAVFNKIWYGLTADGSAPSPAVDNGWGKPLEGDRRWFGPSRGTSLYNAFYSHLFHINAGMAGVKGAFGITTDAVALALQNPTIAGPDFKNATGNGADMWKTLTPAQLANAVDRAAALDPVFANASTDKADLSAFKARGGKMLTWHGANDEMIPTQGTIRYYDSVVQTMGGLANVQSFYKLYIVPGNGHGSPNGTSNPAAHPPVIAGFYEALENWVEHGVAPDRIEMQSPPGSPVHISQPACAYPKKATYVSGDPTVSASYSCS